MVKTAKAKLRIEVFVPLGSCICDFAPFVEKIGRVTSKFKDLVEVQMKSIKSSDAAKYGLQQIAVVVDERIKLSADFVEEELEHAITEARSAGQ